MFMEPIGPSGCFALGVVLNHILGPFYIFKESIGSERMVRLVSIGGDVLLNIIFFKYIYYTAKNVIMHRS